MLAPGIEPVTQQWKARVLLIYLISDENLRKYLACFPFENNDIKTAVQKVMIIAQAIYIFSFQYFVI